MTKTFPTAFAERNKIAIALIGMTVMAVLCLLTFNAASLPIIGGGKVYSAQFAEAGGLKEGNEVRVAGVKVGKVTDISLDGAVVSVKFRAKIDDLGVRAIDPRTLEISLERSTPYFLELLTHQTGLPVHPASVEKFGTNSFST